METENNAEQQLQRRALRAALEWLSSDDFEPEARATTFDRSLTVRQVYDELDRKHGYTHPALVQAKENYEQTVRYLVRESGWFRVEERKVGRPRTLDFSPAEEHRAERKLSWFVWDRSEKTEQHLNRVAGYSQPSNAWVVTLQDAVWRDLLIEVTATKLEGKTRAEVAELLSVPKNVADAFVRYLTKNGWRESKVRVDGGRKNVLKQQQAQTVGA